MSGAVNLGVAGVSSVRLTGLRISTGGTPFPFPIRATVRHNRWFQANTFEVKISLYGSDFDFAWWGDSGRIDDFPMEIEFGVGESQNGYGGLTWNQMMIGQVDNISCDIGNGVVTATGRDLTSRLINFYVKKDYSKWKVDDIIADLAQQLGLKLDIRRKYDTQQSAADLFRGEEWFFTIGGQFNQNVSALDLIALLVQRTNRIFQVSLDTLLVLPDDAYSDIWDLTFTPPDNTAPVVKLAATNFTKMMCTRDVNLSRNLSVIVESQNAGDKKPIRGYDNRTLQQGLSTSHITHVHPGLTTPEQANEIAESIFNRIIKHEKKISWVEPGDLYLNVLHRIRLVGGSTPWHQEYYLENIERTMTIDGGFSMRCTATNADPKLATIVSF